MRVTVPINLPPNLEDEIKNKIASVIVEGAEQATNLYYDLTPYPNKTQLRKALGVGNDKIEMWIAEGLRMTRFSDGDHRFDREDIRKFFNDRKL